MTYRCPNCNSDNYQKNGSYFRKEDSKNIQRLRCKDCKKQFSYGTFSSCYKQKKRRVNPLLLKLLSSGVSQRRCALILNINLKTVARKLTFLAYQSKMKHKAWLKNQHVSHMQFDDLITIHHTKLKPVTVTVAIDADKRTILGIDVGDIPAFGHLAKISKRKYGFRGNEHKKSLQSVFGQIVSTLDQKLKIDSDQHKNYYEIVKQYCPHSSYRQYKSEKACVVGQGELKRKRNDPLFKINHTLAMLRANVNRLFRRSWNTTKDTQCLLDHLWIYVHFHNTVLVA